MQKLKILNFLFVVFLAGCAKPGMKEFLEVSYDHKVLTEDTCHAIIISIRDDIEYMKSLDKLSPEMERAAEELIERLEMMNKQSDLLHEYVISEMVDSSLISELIKSKWKKG